MRMHEYIIVCWFNVRLEVRPSLESLFRWRGPFLCSVVVVVVGTYIGTVVAVPVVPVRASIKSVGGLCCRWGCLGVGSSTCFEVLGIRFCWLSVRFRFRNSFDSLLSLRLSLSFLASSSAFFFTVPSIFFISSSLVVPFSFSLGSPVPL